MIPSHPTDEEDTAYHEAGHAVVGAVRGRPPNFVTIIRHGDVAGKNMFPEDWRPEFKNYLGDSPEKRDYIETRILTEVAGTIAHDLRFPGRAHDSGDAYDERYARALVEENAVWADNDRDGYLQHLKETARGLLQANWPWVEDVARALIRTEEDLEGGSYRAAPKRITPCQVRLAAALKITSLAYWRTNVIIFDAAMKDGETSAND